VFTRRGFLGHIWLIQMKGVRGNSHVAIPKGSGGHPGEMHITKRVEAVARAICRAKGIDPDYSGSPYPPGPVWKYFIPDAFLFIQELDAAQGIDSK
jgi:hypothetical protein